MQKSRTDINTIVDAFSSFRDTQWAWDNFLLCVEQIIRRSDARNILEIGGGRRPSFTAEQIASMDVVYTSNDISAHELSLAPPWVSGAHFDIQGSDITAMKPFLGRFDFAFSRMVMEHVGDYERAYRNIHALLAPGGIAIAFHPVLFSIPFLINKIVSDRITRAILVKFIDPNRTDMGTPKFPAYYSGCYVSSATRKTLHRIGFSDVWQTPFYGHNYYHKIPVIRNVHEYLTKALRRADFTPLASYAFTIVRK